MDSPDAGAGAVRTSGCAARRRTHAALAVVLLLACSGDSSPPTGPPDPPVVPPVVPASVRISPAELVFTAVGDTATLTASASDASGNTIADAEVTWASADTLVATVGTNGLVTATGNGSTQVTATSGPASTMASVRVESPSQGADREALVAFYEATGGDNWTNNANWLSDEPLSRWHGVSVDDRGDVFALNLGENKLAGALPAEVGTLSRLEILNLESNELGGSVPPELGELTRLRFLNLFGNAFEGHVPPDLADLRALETLFIDNNQLSGAIPSAFASLESLQTFYWGQNLGLCAPATMSFEAWRRGRDADGPHCDETDRATLEGLFEAMDGRTWNQATGWLSDALLEEWHGIGTDSLGRVGALDLSRNGLRGPVSPRFADLTHMAVLRLGGNALEGPIPQQLSALALEEFRYEDTQLCVPTSPGFRAWLDAIPTREGTDEQCPPLTDREILAALYAQTGGDSWTRRDNWLGDAPLGDWYGVVTDTQGDVTGLELRGNNLRGPIPLELEQMASLEHLDLSYNWLGGPVPPGLGRLARLEYLDLGSNLLSGTIPSSLSGLAELKYLGLQDNLLEGPIPEYLADLPALTDLLLGLNHLSGPIPPGLGGLTELRTLYLHVNGLEGPVPPELGNLSSLEDLRLSANRLDGPIPPELGRLSSVQVIWLDENELDGPIPPELADLHSLRTLYLGFNNLSGEIPSALGSLASISDLALDGNRLTGPIPPELGGLGSLTGELNLRMNALSGPIPPELGGLEALTILRLGHNDLSGQVPSELGRLASLDWLDVANNPKLAGPLPPSLAQLRYLSRVETAGTGLCLAGGPGDPAWVGLVRLPACQPTTATSRAYLVQTVQSLSYPVPLLAGEEALLRVFVTATGSTAATIPPAKATFFVNGEEIHSVEVPGQPTPIPTGFAGAESSLANSANVRIPGDVVRPGLEMVIDVDPDGTLDPGLGVSTRIPESGRMAVAVRAMPTFNLTVVPFLWRDGPDSTAARLAVEMAADPKGHRLLWDTRTLLPVAGMGVHAHEPVWTTSNDVDELLDLVGAVRAMEGGTGHYMAAMSGEPTGPWGVAWIPGWTSSVRLGAVDTAEEALTIAHELGHNMRLWHAPCGTDATLDPGYPHDDGATGAWGIDSRPGRDVLVSAATADLMSYCVPAWIGDYNFSKALRYRHISEVADPPRANAPSLLLWGGTETDGTPFLRPAFAVDAPPSPPPSDGPHRLVGRTTDGEVAFSFGFEMTPVADREGRAGFVFAIPHSAERDGILGAIELSGPAGSATLDRTTDRPSVILRERDGGRVRAILLDRMPAVTAAEGAPGLSPDVEVLFSRGLPEGRPDGR